MIGTVARACLTAAAFIGICLAGATGAFAQSNPAYIKLGLAKGALYKPDNGPAPHIGVIVIHRSSNYLSHPACTELSRRGFEVMCLNSRYDNNEILLRFEPIALDIKAAMEYLRKEPGITKVMLFGHSGGGSMLAFYEAVAENGVAYCQDPKRLSKCADDLAGLPKADGLIFADAHPGEAQQIMRGLNPSYIYDAKTDTVRVDPSLDPFNPKNGYNPHGKSHFSAAFQARYFKAQAKEIDDYIDLAQKKLKRKGLFSDDGVMIIHGAGNPGSGDSGRAFLFVMDPDIASIGSTVRPEKLLQNNGKIVRQLIHSVKPANPNLIKDNETIDKGSKIYTYRAFLSSNAMRATSSLDGIDYCTSNNSAGCALPQITLPLLIMAMGANDFVRDDEKMFDSAKSKDKDYIVIAGALHRFDPCTACETTPGEYSNSEKNLFDYTADWINKRF